ncbi:MAG: CoA activase [Chloroflexi bacterium]|nr:CoA activase [Chloroflexota bacterium]
MITAGVDVGAETVKVVILKDGEVLASSIVKAGLDRQKSAEEAMGNALNAAKISKSNIQKITATGIGRKEISWATDMVTEIAAAAKGANKLFPSARTVIDIGAEESRGVKVNADGKVIDFAKNEKCAAGVGSFVESMSRAIETTVEQMGPLSLKSDKIIPMNVTCVVFAESEVVSLIHAKQTKEDIARAIHEAIATRTTSMVRRVGIEKDIALIGGVANNPGVIERLTQHLGTAPLVPKDPQLVGALGAALLAAS